MKEFINWHNCSLKDSIAVGDSDSDIPMLSYVEKPIAFNPSRELYEHAKLNNWDVVIERKNVVYKLRPSNQGYILK